MVVTLIVAFCSGGGMAKAVAGIAVGFVVMAGAAVLGASVERVVLALAGATVVWAVEVQVVGGGVDIIFGSHIVPLSVLEVRTV